jgi:uncharacterized protein with HEPN domain
MYDPALILQILEEISIAARRIQERFKSIKSVADFTDSEAGIEKLDGICMQLIAIGENLKQLDKYSDSSLLIQYPEIDWKGAKGLRDIISHNYFRIDAEQIYFVCRNKLSPLHQIILQMISDIQSDIQEAKPNGNP